MLINRAVFTRASVPTPLIRRAWSIVVLMPFFLAALTPADASIPRPKPRPTAPTISKAPLVAPAPTKTIPTPVPKPSHRPRWALPSKPAGPYEAAFDLAKAGAWTKLKTLQRAPVSPALETVLTWMRLEHRNSKTSFQELAKFLEEHPVFPRRRRLVERAEALLDDTVPNETKLKWFRNVPPTTTTGRLKFIAALKQAGDDDALLEAVRKTWLHARFSKRGQRRFRLEHRSILDSASHWRRLDRLLWRGEGRAARAMMPLVTPERRRLAEARIRLRGMSAGVDTAVKRVPEALRGDPGLIYERMRWRNKKGLKTEALELLWGMPPAPLFRSLWWNERSRQVRYALDSGRLEDAYLLATSHIQRSGVSFADAQWHAGWVTLRYRNRPDEAARYFTELHQAVKTPISRGRAAYWAGRALDAAGSATAARQWYARAARHHTTFYGQLAADRVPSSIDRLPSAPTPSAAIRTGSGTRKLVEIAGALASRGRDKLAKLFLRTVAQATRVRDEAVLIASSARAFGYIDLGVYTARVAARSGHILTDAGYPLIKVPRRGAPEPALTLAVIRQESSFDEAARSRVGALGLMQLMPATARHVSKDLKIAYGKQRLTADPAYNMRLGSHYLKKQIDAFDGSYVLAVAAYNAGPHRVRRWLKERGDPRAPDVDMIDWIERIPFAETRNYVQRVLESLHVYRLRLGSSETGWQAVMASPGAGGCMNPRSSTTAPAACAATVTTASQ